jgi:hypothetical protein
MTESGFPDAVKPLVATVAKGSRPVQHVESQQSCLQQAAAGQERKSRHANEQLQSGHCATPEPKPVANRQGIRDDAWKVAGEPRNDRGRRRAEGER